MNSNQINEEEENIVLPDLNNEEIEKTKKLKNDNSDETGDFDDVDMPKKIKE